MKIICVADAFVTPAMMKRNAYLINCARSYLVDSEAFRKAPVFAIKNYLGFLEGAELKFRVN